MQKFSVQIAMLVAAFVLASTARGAPGVPGVPAASNDSAAVPAPAAAAGTPATPQEEMRRHHDRGTIQYNLGQFEDAVSEYRKAYEIKAEPVFLFNIAQAYRQLGAADKALFFYKRYLSTAPAASNRLQVEERIAELEPIVAAQTRGRAESLPDAADGTGTGPSPSPGPRSSHLAAAPALASVLANTGEAPAGVTTVSITPVETRRLQASHAWQKWWFWAGVGAVVIGGVATSFLIGRGDGHSQIPTTDLGNMRVF